MRSLTPRLSPLFTLTLLLACGTDPVANDTDGSSGTDASTSDVTMTSAATLTSTTSSMSTSNSTSEGTTETTTMVTTDTDPTTGDTSGDTTDPTTGTATDPGSDSGESSSTGTNPAPSYGPCEFPDGEPTCAEGEQCNVLPGGGQHWCGVPCLQDPDVCPEAASGDAAVECSGFFMACALNCAADGAMCPDGMECVAIQGANVSRCGWPPGP